MRLSGLVGDARREEIRALAIARADLAARLHLELGHEHPTTPILARLPAAVFLALEGAQRAGTLTTAELACAVAAVVGQEAA